MDKESKMIGILPAIFTDNADLQALFSAETVELDLLAGQLNKARQDQFIATATAIGISRWEAILNIQADTLLETLEDRRRRVQIKLLERIPFTYRTLKEKLAAILGDIPFEAVLDHNQYQLIITIDTQQVLADIYYKQLDETLYIMVPANLFTIVRILRKQCRPVYIGATTAIGTKVTILPWQSKDLKSKCSLQLGIATAQHNKLIIYPKGYKKQRMMAETNAVRIKQLFKQYTQLKIYTNEVKK